MRPIDTAKCLTSRGAGAGNLDAETANIITYPINTQLGLRGETSNTSREGICIGNEGDPAFTLQRVHGHAVATLTSNGDAHSGFRDENGLVAAYSVRTANTSSNGWGIQEEVSHTLDRTSGVAVAFAQNTRDEVREMPIVGALAAQPGMKQTSYIRSAMQVRRLTPIECERLQGFQDDYTKINSKTADGPRYKALGNSMAVPVMRWIGEQIERASA